MITTKRGDKGETDCGGKRVGKDDILVETIGEIDELQAVLYLVGSQISDFRSQLDKIIKDLGVIMGVLGSNKKCLISNFEFLINTMEKEIEKSKINIDNFVVFKKKKANSNSGSGNSN